MVDIFSNPIALAGLSVMRGQDPGQALMEAQKSQAYTQHLTLANQQQQYQLDQQQKLQQILPQVMAQMGDKSPMEIMQELTAQGIPYDAAISISDSISKAQQRQQMGDFIESQMGGAPGAGGGNNLSKTLALQDAMRGNPAAFIALQTKEDQITRDEKNYRDQVSIPGYEPAEGYRPTNTDATEVKKALRSATKIKRLGGALKEKVSAYGFQPGVTLPLLGTKVGSKEFREMDRIIKAIQLEQKNLDELGALSGPDTQFLNQAPDPTSFFESESYGSPDEFNNQMDQYLNNIQSSVDEAATTYGYKPSAVRTDAKNEDDDLDALLTEMKKRGLK